MNLEKINWMVVGTAEAYLSFLLGFKPSEDLVSRVASHCWKSNIVHGREQWSSTALTPMGDFVLGHEPGLRLAAVELFLALEAPCR